MCIVSCCSDTYLIRVKQFRRNPEHKNARTFKLEKELAHPNCIAGDYTTLLDKGDKYILIKKRYYSRIFLKTNNKIVLYHKLLCATV